MPYIYILHFSSRYKHAAHYTGICGDLTERLKQHKIGSHGANLCRVARAAGIKFHLVRTWYENTLFDCRQRERTIKLAGAGRYCPVCKGLETLPEQIEFDWSEIQEIEY